MKNKCHFLWSIKQVDRDNFFTEICTWKIVKLTCGTCIFSLELSLINECKYVQFYIEHVTSESSDCESVSMSPETIVTVVGKKP